MVALISLMNLSIPPNLYSLLNYIEAPMSFNQLQINSFAPWLFGLDPANQKYGNYTDNFSEQGFDTNIVVLNLGDTMIYLAIFIIGMPFSLMVLRMPIF